MLTVEVEEIQGKQDVEGGEGRGEDGVECCVVEGCEEASRQAGEDFSEEVGAF